MQERINSLDFLRGIAVLGILIINIESFAFPIQFSPYLYGFSTELDTTVRFWVYYLAQGKFFTMFVVLFGVSFYLMLERLQEKHTTKDVFGIYTRRLFILFIFGAVHTYFIWSGDILHHYAICALLLLPVRDFTMRGLTLFIIAMLFIILGNSFEKVQNKQQQNLEYQQALKIEEGERTNIQNRAVWRWESKLEKKSTERYADKEKTKKGSYVDNLQSNWNEIKLYKGELFFKIILFDSLMLMTIGILLYRLGIFSDYRSVPYYWQITFVLFGLGLWTGYIKYQWWSYEYLNPITEVYLEIIKKIAAYIQGLSYLLFINGIYQVIPNIRKLTAINKVGKMALSSYIFHSIICALIFYGYGLNYHNELSRSDLIWLVITIWLVNILFCHFWLKFYKQGPLETIWRKLSYQGI